MTSQHGSATSSRREGPTALHYEREAGQTRRRLAENLDELSERLTPGQVVDELLTYSRAGGGSFMRAFSNAVKENPIPALLIGAGCMLFLSEKMGGRVLPRGAGVRAARHDEDESRTGFPSTTARVSDAASAARASTSNVAGRVGESAQKMMRDAAGSTASAARSAAESVQSGMRSVSDRAAQHAADVTETVRQAAASVTDTVAGATDAVRSKTNDLREQATGTVSQLTRGAQNVAGSIRQYSSSYGGRISETAGRTRRQATDMARHSRQTATSLISEQPLLCAAVGVAVGAAIASMLPPTETEDQWMGEASDAVKGAAGEAASEGFEHAKDVAGAAVERATEAAKRGAITGGAQEAARSLAEGIREATSEPTPIGGSEQSPVSGGWRGSSQERPLSGAGPQEFPVSSS